MQVQEYLIFFFTIGTLFTVFTPCTRSEQTCDEGLYLLESRQKCVDFKHDAKNAAKENCMNDMNSPDGYEKSRLVLIPISEDPSSKRVICGCKSEPGDEGLNTFKHKPLVYDIDGNACYLSFTQESCKESYWLVPTGNGIHECIPNKCLSSGIDSNKVVLYNDTCVSLGEVCGEDRGNKYEINAKSGLVVCQWQQVPYNGGYIPRKPQSLIMTSTGK